MLPGDYILVSLRAINTFCLFLPLLYVFTSDEGLCRLGGKAQNQGCDTPLGRYNGPCTAPAPSAPSCLHRGPPGPLVDSGLLACDAPQGLREVAKQSNKSRRWEI